MELTILSFVRASERPIVHLYLPSCQRHVNYAPRLPVHLVNMLSLEQKHPDVYQWFQSGKFVAFKSCRTFSAMIIDQTHEQANDVTKGEGGATGMAEDPSALRIWMVAGSCNRV